MLYFNYVLPPTTLSVPGVFSPMTSEAKARVKIINLLEASGWRFFDDDIVSANIQLETNVKINKRILIHLVRILNPPKLNR